VTIGIGLDHGHDPGARSTRPDLIKIMPEGPGIDNDLAAHQWSFLILIIGYQESSGTLSWL
jgi:hypothetical protein